ncbi:hypothetical protein FSP39_016213 [Pinctada imbricata]|uniref:Uncharacterized protein n=1 Tax=Pinctada imbricata TaxID=66713 RepID=A0AA89C7S9_PINIB|nr:hypothetical protein FSP39_016213 [Pinctada imbricata]
MSISQLQSTAPHVQCADSCRSYCILSCMAEKHSIYSGSVSLDCLCDPGQTTDAATGIPSSCFEPQGECDFFSDCLQSRFTNCSLDITGLISQCTWLADAMSGFTNCSSKEWLREVRYCFQSYFVPNLDSEANTTCSELTNKMNSESYDQCLRLTTDNLDFCDLSEEDKDKIRSSFFSTFSSELRNNINSTLAWMENC